MSMAFDRREVARQVNNMMLDQYNKRVSEKYSREVEFFPRGYLFGHYDSRGGGGLVIASTFIEALNTYIYHLFGGDADPDMIMADDWMGAVEVSVWDRPLPRHNVDIYLGYTPHFQTMFLEDFKDKDSELYKQFKAQADAVPQDIRDLEGYIVMRGLEELQRSSLILALPNNIVVPFSSIPEEVQHDRNKMGPWAEENGFLYDEDSSGEVLVPGGVPGGYQVYDPSEDAFGLFLMWAPSVSGKVHPDIPYDKLLSHRSRLIVDFYSDKPETIKNMASTIEQSCILPLYSIDGMGKVITFTASMDKPEQVSEEEKSQIMAGLQMDTPEE